MSRLEKGMWMCDQCEHAFPDDQKDVGYHTERFDLDLCYGCSSSNDLLMHVIELLLQNTRERDELEILLNRCSERCKNSVDAIEEYRKTRRIFAESGS